MKKIETERFGQLEIEEERIIHFPEGILGFPEQKNYVVLEHSPGSAFCWLQSVDNPGLAFVMADPLQVKEGYVEGLSPEEKSFLNDNNNIDPIIMAIVTIPRGEVEKMTINLMGPLVIDSENRTGRQVILANSGYDHRYPISQN